MIATIPKQYTGDGADQPPLAMSSPNGQFCFTETPDGWISSHLSSTGEIIPLIEAVIAKMASLCFSDKDIFGMRLALEEALVNSVKHGHRYESTKKVEIRYRVCHEHTLVQIQDQGSGFDPTWIPDPTAPENLARPCGRGVLLRRFYTTWIRYNERGNCVTLCKCPSVAAMNGTE
jgi:serine/threonine-protein kinase RsbW